jgi:transposase
MWAFRRRQKDLSEEQTRGLNELFQQIPELEFVYHFRWGVTEIFDEPHDREEAASRLEDYRKLVSDQGEEAEALLAFFRTYDQHRDGILAYFDERKTSGVVEGINNKARVITKRCYGIKSVQTLWNRLCLDVNCAWQAACHTIHRIKELTDTIRHKFLGFYT